MPRRKKRGFPTLALYHFMKHPPWNRHLSCIIKSALLGGLLIATTALASPPSSNPIQSFSASPGTITAGQTTTLTWVVEAAKDVRLSGVSDTPASSAVVAPTHTTTYTLTATTGWGKSVSQDVIVNVTADPSIATAEIDPANPGSAIPAGFLGLSHEWGQAQLLMGDPAIGTNPIYRQLLDNLTAYGGGPISLRIGGNSTDSTALPDASTVSAFAQLFEDQSSSASPWRNDFGNDNARRRGRKDGVSFYLGVNLGSDSVALATSQAQVFVQNMPKGSIQAIEIGNEPDFYPIVSHHRPSTYDFADYAQDFLTWRTSIFAAIPDSPLVMGPSDAEFPSLPLSSNGITITTTYLTVPNMVSFLQQERSALAVVSQHHYTTFSSNVGGNPQPGILLEPASTTANPAVAAAYEVVARQAGKPYRIAEGNSIAGSGQAGITNAFEETLWAPDVLFEYAKIGAVGFNFHSNDWNSFNQWDAYAAFHFFVPVAQFNAAYAHYSAADGVQPPTPVLPPMLPGQPTDAFSSKYAVREIQALYYGMLFFAEATAHQGRLLPVTLNTSANLKAWATLDPTNGDVNIAIINKDKTASGSVQLTVPGYKRGLVKRLLAPSFSSITGITIGGQTFDGSQDGKPVGTAYGEFTRSQNGTFEVSVGPTSAFLLTLKKRDRDRDDD
jgi:Glycosyl hydrolase family 79 C-terminal beta domain